MPNANSSGGQMPSRTAIKQDPRMMLMMMTIDCFRYSSTSTAVACGLSKHKHKQKQHSQQRIACALRISEHKRGKNLCI
jgi:hypothetical protein